MTYPGMQKITAVPGQLRRRYLDHEIVVTSHVGGDYLWSVYYCDSVTKMRVATGRAGKVTGAIDAAARWIEKEVEG